MIDNSEAEIELLLAGARKEDMPQGLIDKAGQCHLDLSFESLPRNLRAMFAATMV
jgi:hypothetical protein